MLTPKIARTRWRPVVPLGIPHATTKADVYDGYDIPKGATVFGNIEYVFDLFFEQTSSRAIYRNFVIPQCSTKGPKSIRRPGDVQSFTIYDPTQACRKLEWQSRKRVYDSFRVRTTRLSRNARGTPIYFHLLSTVCSRNPPHRTRLIVTLLVSAGGRIFWAFDVLPATEGSSIDHTKTVHRGITREPAEFQFRVRSRHPDVERIIDSESAYADLRLKEWEY